VAELQRIKYDALIEQGFNEVQAVELCKNILGMNDFG